MRNMPGAESRTSLGRLSYSFTDETGKKFSGRVNLDSNEPLSPEVEAFLRTAVGSLNSITPENILAESEGDKVPFTEFINGTTTEGRMTREQMRAVDDSVARFLLDAIVLMPKLSATEFPDDNVILSRRRFSSTDVEALPHQSLGK